MKRLTIAALWVVGMLACFQRDPGPQPTPIDPGGPGQAPSDAVLLFNGKDMAGWQTRRSTGRSCEVADQVMSCATGSGDIYTTGEFRHAQIHLEFAVPHMPEQRGQLRGNSGIYLQGRYEIQILDSFENPTYGHGSLGGLYGQAAPLVNPARKPGEWQSYDIIFHGPECGAGGKVVKKATVTVLLNGVLVQDHVSINASEKLGKGCQAGPLLIQDHSGFPGAPLTVMRFRNIWLRHLDR